MCGLSRSVLNAIAATGMALGGWLVGTPSAAAQEFDCRKALYASERTICRNDKLGALDEHMSGLYSELMQTYGGKGERKSLREYQRRFLAARDDCGRDSGCIRGAYLDQIGVLESRLDRANRRSER